MDIKALRKHLKLTQVELSTLLGIRQATISNWEHGLQKPTRAALSRLNEIKGFHPEDEVYPDKTNLDKSMGRVIKVTTFKGTSLKLAHIEKGGVVLTRGLKILKLKD